MNAVITPSRLIGSVAAPASKSAMHRLLICAALSDKSTFIECNEISQDISATVRCLQGLGAVINRTANGFTVTPLSGSCENAVLDCGESGSTLRFLLPVVCALGINAKFILSGRLPKRPMKPLWEQLIAHGAILERPAENTIVCKGYITGGEYTLDAGISSQFISGLMLALVLLKAESKIILTGEAQSVPYIDMTADIQRKFCIKHHMDAASKSICVSPSKYISPLSITCEGDWSNAAFWLCAGAFSDITCTALDTASPQGDRAITRLLAEFGADVKQNNGEVTVRGKSLKAIRIDAGNIPDIVPVLAAVAAVSEGITIIYNAHRLRYKESDRLEATIKMLRSLGANATVTDDFLIIKGKKNLDGGIVDCCGDHRIVMSAAVASCVCENAVTLTAVQAVAKSYPDFFKQFNALGGKAVLKSDTIKN